MTKPVNSSHRGTLPCVGAISDASTSARLVAAREAALPVLVDLAPRLVLADLLFLAHRQVRADLADLAQVPVEEVPGEVRHRSRSAAMAER